MNNIATTTTPARRLVNVHTCRGVNRSGEFILGEGAWGEPADALAAAAGFGVWGIVIIDVRTGERFPVPAELEVAR